MSAGLRFTKMSGAGNDFVVLDSEAWDSVPQDRAAWVRAVCRRGLSVGADGVLVVLREGGGRVRVVFFNPDGGEAFCGNGSRCAARFAHLHRIASGPDMTLRTAVGDVPAIVTGDHVRLTLPPPEDLGAITLAVGAESYRGRWVNAGVPHVVIPVSGLAGYAIERLGPALRRHDKLGPEGANVDLVESDSAGRVHVRTWERGVENETLACGTGAVAVAMAARIAGAPEDIVVVPRSRSILTVSLPGDPVKPAAAILSGDARLVFHGFLDPDATMSPS